MTPQTAVFGAEASWTSGSKGRQEVEQILRPHVLVSVGVKHARAANKLTGAVIQRGGGRIIAGLRVCASEACVIAVSRIHACE